MSTVLQRELEKLKRAILAQCAAVQSQVRNAITAVARRDESLAVKVIQSDAEIDAKEVEIEEECLKLIALHQPVASDLRFIITALKINNDLERIGDLAVNIAERSVSLCRENEKVVHSSPVDLTRMVETTRLMLENSIKSLVNLDTELAKKVRLLDDEVDEENRKMFRTVIREAQKHPEILPCLMSMLSVSRYLERIADLASNIAEDVIYLVHGEIVRHRSSG